MGLKILHTSDWHLGANLYNTSREDEHALFLEWLLQTLRDTRADVLLMAGDVFHYAHPSAEALRLYYRFLARVGQETAVQQVVMVGGNHDSAARLDAPREILDMLRVHMVGGLQRKPAEMERALCPIRRDNGEVGCVIAAVPYVHEFRLGVRTTGRPLPEVRAEIEEAFRSLYTELADLAQARWPGVPLITTGHLTCSGANEGDYGTPIHMAALIGGLPPEIFDPRFAYVALGHIHRPFSVDGDRAWYCGSPVPLSSEEARWRQRVILLDVDGTDTHPVVSLEHIEIPRWRDLLELKGSSDELVAQMLALRPTRALPPLLYVEATVDHYQLDVARPMLDALAMLPSEHRPRILRITQTLKAPELEDDPFNLPTTPLRDLDPEDVFARLVRLKQQTEPREALLVAFRELLHDLK
jgi:exonuclease SbcD